MTNNPIPDIKKIAVLRANALGDFIVTLPALEALRNAYPHAEIILLGKEWHKTFLEPKRCAIDRVMVIPVSNGLREENGKSENKEDLEIFFNQIRDEKIDVAIHFHGNGKSANSFINKLGARLTAGLYTEGAEKLSFMLPFYYYQNEMVRYLEVVDMLGATTGILEPKLEVHSLDITEADVFMDEMKLPENFIVLHPVATDIRRMWPGENFAHLADKLNLFGLQPVFSGAKEDVDFINQIRAQMKTFAPDTCGKLSLRGLTGLLSKALAVVSSDTGPLHLARAVNTKTVGIHWAPNLINWGPLTRGRHRPVVSWDMQCPFCGIIPNDPYPYQPHLDDCKHEISFVRNITVDQVWKELMLIVNSFY